MVNFGSSPMIKRKLKLAQVVCAVYSLNKPIGASKTEIIRFCKHRFGSTCSSKELDRILERGLDEGLLTSFRKRYRVTKLRFEILWSERIGGVRRKRFTRRGKKQSKGKAVLKKRRNLNIKSKPILKRQSKPETDSNLKTSCLYELWKQKFKQSIQREIEIMKKMVKNVSGGGKKNHCKPRKSGRLKARLSSKSKRQSLKLMTRKKGGITQRKHKMNKNSILKKIKRSIRLKRSHKKEKRSVGSRRTVNGSKKSGRNSSASTRNSEVGNNDKFHRAILKQTKQATVHAKSWDKLNYARQRGVRENEALVKKSQLVQKILTQAHSQSWDDLNLKLMHLKVANCSRQQT